MVIFQIPNLFGCQVFKCLLYSNNGLDTEHQQTRFYHLNTGPVRYKFGSSLYFYFSAPCCSKHHSKAPTKSSRKRVRSTSPLLPAAIQPQAKRPAFGASTSSTPLTAVSNPLFNISNLVISSLPSISSVQQKASPLMTSHQVVTSNLAVPAMPTTPASTHLNQVRISHSASTQKVQIYSNPLIFFILICVQWGSEYLTSMVFKWFKDVRSANGPVFECHLNTRLF